ncbi:MAG: hypothetical protein KA383_02535 [Phycisphaerae bacterium]|nr:hypothetical protein [Phycisphaerae bacterium]
MQTNALGAVTGTATATRAGSMNELTSADFFNLLVTELRQQDPLEPTKTADMISQVSQIRSIELSKNLTDALTQLSQQQHTSGTAELLGKYVTAMLVDSSGTVQEISGIVTGVRFDADGTAVLELDTGQYIPAANVTRITAAQNAATQTTATTDATDKTGTTASTKKDKAGASEDAGPLPWLSLSGSLNL